MNEFSKKKMLLLALIICFLLFWFVFALFYFYYLVVCLFSNERQRDWRFECEEKWGGSWRNWWRGNNNQNVLYEKSQISIKWKKKYYKSKWKTIHRKSELMRFPSENKIDMISIITTVFYNLNGILVFWKYYILYNKNMIQYTLYHFNRLNFSHFKIN